MKKSICIEKLFTEHEFYERFPRVKKCGFDYVEFWSWSDKDIVRIHELCDEYSLKVASISGDRDFSLIDCNQREAYLDFLQRSIDAAMLLNCEYLVLHSNALGRDGRISVPGTSSGVYGQTAAMVRTLMEAVKLAEKAGVILVLEALNTRTQPGNFLCKTADSGDICKEVDSPNLGILYDIWHMQQMEGDLLYHLHTYRDVIRYIHLADCPGRHEPGTGEINFDAVGKMLKEIEYEGILGFELIPQTTSEAAAACIDALWRS